MIEPSIIIKKKMELGEAKDMENALANEEYHRVNIDDMMNALVELGELFAEQDDALVELAALIAGFLLFFMMTVISYRTSCRNFDKIDL